MIARVVYLLVCFCLASFAIQAQVEERRSLSDMLAFVTSLDDMTESKSEINANFKNAIIEELQIEGSYDKSFEELKPYLSILSTPQIRIFTWQVMIDLDTYAYFGIIQSSKDPHSPIVLDDVSDELIISDMMEMSRGDWFGCYYYNMIPHVSNAGDTVYILFGYDSNDRFSNKKIIDVLHVDTLGEVRFGYPLFYHDDGPKYRRVFDADATASTRVNFDADMNMIIFNHLVAGAPEQEGLDIAKSVEVYQEVNGEIILQEIDPTKAIVRPEQGRIMFKPDGSYQGYKLVDGRWVFVDKVFDQISTEAPRPKPLFNSEKEE